jgi:hypothetical protein
MMSRGSAGSVGSVGATLRADELLLELHRAVRVVPDQLEVLSERDQFAPFIRCRHATTLLGFAKLRSRSLEFLESRVPSLFELLRDQPVARVDFVVLLERPARLVVELLDAPAQHHHRISWRCFGPTVDLLGPLVSSRTPTPSCPPTLRVTDDYRGRACSPVSSPPTTDVTTCPCGGRLRPLGAVLTPEDIAAHLHGARAPPRPTPAGQLSLLP